MQNLRAVSKKVKLDEFDVWVVINGLYLMRTEYCAEKRNDVDEVLRLLLDVHDTMKPNGRRKKIPF